MLHYILFSVGCIILVSYINDVNMECGLKMSVKKTKIGH